MARATGVRGFLSRLRKDVRGNALAIMAASIIPLAGLVGGGIDIARTYIVKTRLQHACDAGALAGRKAMGGGTWDQSSYMPRTTASQFFVGNFITGSYGSNSLAYAFSENAGKVSGTASANVPLTLMQIFGLKQATVSVNCDAEMRLPNTDVMFVLDVTGSMGDTLPGDTQTKISALHTAVKCFYEIVARQDTDANCSTGTPSGGLDSQVQVRFGFVPFDLNVNVGRLLPTQWFANKWPYQSREVATLYGTFSSWDGTTRNAGAYSAWQNTSTSAPASNSNNCSASLIAVPADTYDINSAATSWPDSESSTGWRAYVNTTQNHYQRSYNSSTKICYLQKQTRSIDRRALWTRATQSTSGAVAFPAWSYKQVTLDVSSLKAANTGVNWNSGVTLPLANAYAANNNAVPLASQYANQTYAWDGCIEERKTIRATDYDPIPSDARDLDIDGVPSQSDADSLWGPAIRDLIYPRKASYTNSGSQTLDTQTNFNQNYTGEAYDCPAPAHKLEQWTDTGAFDTYVDSLQPGGNTYHDLGLLWGGRLMSPTGIFSSENAYTPQGGEILRNMIFMTDGDACTDNMNYQAYGLAWYDRRQTDPSQVPTDGCTAGVKTPGTLTQQVNLRSAALCTAIKNKNITLWVVYFGSASSNVATQMQACASPGRFFQATNSSALQTTFAQIANQISQLRLTK